MPYRVRKIPVKSGKNWAIQRREGKTWAVVGRSKTRELAQASIRARHAHER